MAQQVRSELAHFLSIVKESAPRRIMEIGTSRGGTLFLICRRADPNAHLISLDLPGGPGGGGYAFYRIPLYRSFALPGQKLSLLRGDSHDADMLQKVKNLLGSEKIDLLLIDGDHAYDGVKKDYGLYSPPVRAGGLIALHDIAPHAPETGVGVPRFWNEIKATANHEEVIESPDQGWGGIGILHQ